MASGVLIIDDEVSLARNIKEYLDVDGFETHTCTDGEQGIALFDAFRPEIVVVDLRLPGIDGLTVLQQLHTRKTGAKFILMTAYGDGQTAVAAIHAGAFDYIAKPVVLSELKRVIGRALEELQRPWPMEP